MRPHFGRCFGLASLLIAACITVFVQSGPAAATGTRAFTQDFGITPNVFTTPATGPIPVGGAVPANLVIIDNDPSCVGPSFSSCLEPTGTVSITAEDSAHNVVTLGTQTLSSVPSQPGRAGQAVFSFPATLVPGDYLIEASYSGDSNFAGGAVPAALLLTITKATPTVTLTQNHTTTHPGAGFTVTAAVTYPSTAASGDPLEPETPTGSITLTNSDGSPVTLPLGADGRVTFSIAGPDTVGDVTFHGSYTGDADIDAGTSAALVHHVVAITTTTSAPPTSAATTPTPSSSGPILAETGVRSTSLLVIAIGLLVVGAGVLAASRRTGRTH
jgi:hypothetical protein